MITPQNHSSSRCIASADQAYHVPLEQIYGVVFISPHTPCWIPAPTENGENSLLMGDYPEIFKGKGEVVLCLYIGLNDFHSQKLHPTDGRYPMYLPLDLFIGKREGDVLEIVCKKKARVFKLTCEQKNSRYKDLHKPFEEMVEEVFMKAYKKLEVKSKGNLTEHEQYCWNIIQTKKCDHYPNVEVKI